MPSSENGILYRVYTKQKSSSSSFCYFDDNQGLAWINLESDVYTYSTNSEFEFKNWSSISRIHSVKDHTSCLMNINSITIPVYTAEKV